MKSVAYLFLNGELEGDKIFFKNYISEKPGEIYCADGGYRHCKKLNLIPKEIWGDMDSIDLSELQKAEDRGIQLKKFQKDKNYTDGELLIRYVYSLGYRDIYIIGGLGGDRAHELTNLNLITKYSNLIFLTAEETIFSVRKDCRIEGMKNYKISFIPMSEEIENLNLTGFTYPLENYNLQRWESICMSNIIDSDICKISFDSGVLLGILKNR
ncbi:MAG: thiamine diphosphokinase [Fusobacteriaceae bacterium]